MAKKKITPTTEVAFNIQDVPARNIEPLSDFSGTLKDLHAHITYLMNEYGEESHITFDAGYNNVSAQLVTEGDIEKYQKKLRDDLEQRKQAQHSKDVEQFEKLKKKLGM